MGNFRYFRSGPQVQVKTTSKAQALSDTSSDSPEITNKSSKRLDSDFGY